MIMQDVLIILGWTLSYAFKIFTFFSSNVMRLSKAYKVIISYFDSVLSSNDGWQIFRNFPRQGMDLSKLYAHQSFCSRSDFILGPRNNFLPARDTSKKRISAKTYSLLDLLLATAFISLMAINSLKEEVKWVFRHFEYKLKCQNFQRIDFHIILWPRNFDSLCTFCFICCQTDECCWLLYVGIFLCQGKFFELKIDVETDFSIIYTVWFIRYEIHGMIIIQYAAYHMLETWIIKSHDEKTSKELTTNV